MYVYMYVYQLLGDIHVADAYDISTVLRTGFNSAELKEHIDCTVHTVSDIHVSNLTI